MYSTKHEGSQMKTFIHYRTIKHFSVSLTSAMLITTLMVMPPHIFAKGCIQNGAVIAGAALLGFPQTAILSPLPMIAQLGGCGDAINFGAVNLGQLKDFGNVVG
jgi:hypothetical protein